MERLPSGRRSLALVMALFLLTAAVTGCSSKGSTAPPPPVEAQPPQEVLPPPVEPEPEPATPKEPELPGAIAIMVENSPMARPQVGLDQVDLVYELEAEYGISRFMAFFYSNKADRIGPVRSARMGFYDIAAAYALPYGHAGGSEEALAILRQRSSPLLDLDEIYSCGACFWRSKEREAPHNLYTSTDLIVGRAEEVGFPLHPLHPLTEEGELGGGVAASEIAYSWGPSTQEVAWSWDGERYQRSQSGAPHLMEDGAQVAADNLILLFTRYVWDPYAQPWSGLHDIAIVGSGSGYLYRDGKVWPIEWSKSSRHEHYRFTLESGESIRLAPGQTWVGVLKGKSHVSAGRPE